MSDVNKNSTRFKYFRQIRISATLIKERHRQYDTVIFLKSGVEHKGHCSFSDAEVTISAKLLAKEQL